MAEDKRSSSAGRRKQRAKAKTSATSGGGVTGRPGLQDKVSEDGGYLSSRMYASSR